jgi:chemotaxis protein CheD
VRQTTYLHPGQLFAAAEPFAVTTVLGSCVAVCVWDAVAGVGGANHYLLPDGLANGHASLRYGNVAVQRLLERLLSLGARHDRLQSKLFGGACVLDAFRRAETHLGARNVAAGLLAIRQSGIPVVASDTGGDKGRKLIFHTDDGSAWLRTL